MKNTHFLMLLLSSTLLFSACGSSDSKPTEENPITDSHSTTKKLDNSYISFVEENLAYRVQALNTFEKTKDHDPLTGDDHDKIDKLLTNHIKTKAKLEKNINLYQKLLDDSKDYTEKERFERIMVSLSAMLVRYDNYLVAYGNYEENDKLRKRLNEENHNIPKNLLKDMTKEYNSLANREDIKKMIEFFDNNVEQYKNNNERLFDYLRSYIQQSPSYKLGFEDDKIYTFDNLRTLYTHTLDLGGLGLSNLTNELSKGFGNSAGMVETRKGKLYNDDDVTNHLSATLKAGDILLEKTPFRLTDKLIPGHWGHAAVYIGTVEELKALNIWNHEAVVPYHEALENGELIAEALRDGVQLNSVAHFLNVDDVAIIRDTHASDDIRKKRIILNFKQLGKDYDFNFDIETADKIVCSELVYITFTEVDWQTEKVAGTHTISPDNVATKSIEEPTNFEVTLLYHDGEEVNENKKEKMKELLDNEAS